MSKKQRQTHQIIRWIKAHNKRKAPQTFGPGYTMRFHHKSKRIEVETDDGIILTPATEEDRQYLWQWHDAFIGRPLPVSGMITMTLGADGSYHLD